MNILQYYEQIKGAGLHMARSVYDGDQNYILSDNK
jgi:hypothetical protein